MISFYGAVKTYRNGICPFDDYQKQLTGLGRTNILYGDWRALKRACIAAEKYMGDVHNIMKHVELNRFFVVCGGEPRERPFIATPIKYDSAGKHALNVLNAAVTEKRQLAFSTFDQCCKLIMLIKKNNLSPAILRENLKEIRECLSELNEKVWIICAIVDQIIPTKNKDGTDISPKVRIMIDAVKNFTAKVQNMCLWGGKLHCLCDQ